MQKTLKALLIAVPTVFIGACATTGPDGKPEPSLEQLLVNAEAQYKAAEAMDAAWTTTGPELEAAKKAKTNLETEKAVKLARKVLKESKLAQEQAKNNESAKPHYSM